MLSCKKSVFFSVLISLFCCSAVSSKEGPVINDFSKTTHVSILQVITLPKGDGKEFKIWVSYPVSDDIQKVKSFKIETSLGWKITTEKKYGNKTIYLQGKLAAKKQTIRLNYDIERKHYFNFEKSGNNNSKRVAYSQLTGAEKKEIDRFLKPNLLVQIGDNIKTIAKDEGKGAGNVNEYVDKYFNYIVDTLTFRESGKKVGMGDAVWTCDVKTGNCADFHSFLIALLRYREIPSRLVTGLALPRRTKKKAIVNDFHSWMEAFDMNRGWFPLDAQAASLAEEKKWGVRKEFFYQIPSDRVKLSEGRDLILEPRQKGAPVNILKGMYVEIGGVKSDLVKLKYVVHLGK